MAHFQNAHTANDLNSLFNLGVISRFSRVLISSESLDSFYLAAESAFNELQVRGYLLVSTDDVNKKIKLGEGCSKETIKTLLNSKQRDKIVALDTCLRISNKFVTLVCCQSKEKAQSDNLDCLATLCDIAQEYIEHRQTIDGQHLEHKHKQLSAADRVHTVLQCLTTLSDHLVTQGAEIVKELHCKLLTLFPSLSLEYDQEEEIIKLIESTSREMTSLVSAQTLYNHDLEAILNETISALITEIDDTLDTPMFSSKKFQKSVELFQD